MTVPTSDELLAGIMRRIINTGGGEMVDFGYSWCQPYIDITAVRLDLTEDELTAVVQSEGMS